MLVLLYFLSNMLGSGSLLNDLVYFATPCAEFEQNLNWLAHVNTVTQKLMTTPYYCNTLSSTERSHMASVLTIDKQMAIISALAEGSGIRQIERKTGVHNDTIMWLGVCIRASRSSEPCEEFMHGLMLRTIQRSLDAALRCCISCQRLRQKRQ